MSAPSPTAPRARGIELYYLLATPLFALADGVWGVSVRAAFLDGWPAARHGYYVVCFASGLWAWRAPANARLIAMTESSANIILLIFSVMLGYYAAVDKVAAGEPLGESFGPSRALNLVFAAGTLALAYFRAQRPSVS